MRNLCQKGNCLICFLILFISPFFGLQYQKSPSVVQEEETVKRAVKKRLAPYDAPILILNNLKRWFCFCKLNCHCCVTWIKDRLTYWFPSTLPSIKGISIAVRKGECLGVVGPPGSGKSTICKILSGSIFPSYGSAYLNNISLSNCFRRHNVCWNFLHSRLSLLVRFCTKLSLLCRRFTISGTALRLEVYFHVFKERKRWNYLLDWKVFKGLCLKKKSISGLRR